jgi:excisionase family DNA binding protein
MSTDDHDTEPAWVKERQLEHPYPDEVTTTDYAPTSQDQAPAPVGELPAAGETTEPARPVEAASAVAGLTLTEAASAYGVSVTTVRRLVKSGKVPGVLVPGPKGEEYRVQAEALEALGYRLKETRDAEAVKVSRVTLEAEVLEGRVRDLETQLAHERDLRQAAQALADERAARIADKEREATQAQEALREVLAKLPPALPPAAPRRRWFRKGTA